MKPFHKEEIKEKLEKMFRLTAKSSKAKEEVLQDNFKLSFFYVKIKIYKLKE